MSQYVMHCTKPKRDDSGLVLAPVEDVFQEIISDGYLKASFGLIKSTFTFQSSRTVRGERPAVCFTEQPLQFFLQTLKAEPGERYSQFAVALRKDDLFAYGGRPVIYDNPMGANSLPSDHLYRWVCYEPDAIWDRKYPRDFTHEREWRTRPESDLNYRAGLEEEADHVVPLRLPTSRPGAGQTHHFVLFVDSDDRRDELKEWIVEQLPSISARGKYGKKYAVALSEAPVVSFENIEKGRVQRLEEIYPLA